MGVKEFWKDKQKVLLLTALLISIFLFIIYLIFVIYENKVYPGFPASTVTENPNVSILDSKSCEVDDDCILTTIKKFECCASCFLESINKEAEFERVKWREQECEGSRKWEEDKWKSCFEYAECGIHRPSYVAVCIDNKCEMELKEK